MWERYLNRLSTYMRSLRESNGISSSGAQTSKRCHPATDSSGESNGVSETRTHRLPSTMQRWVFRSNSGERGVWRINQRGINDSEELTAVNYHKWQICDPACSLGEELKIPIYRFVKEALIRKFGKEWYQKLENIALDTSE